MFKIIFPALYIIFVTLLTQVCVHKLCSGKQWLYRYEILSLDSFKKTSFEAQITKKRFVAGVFFLTRVNVLTSLLRRFRLTNPRKQECIDHCISTPFVRIRYGFFFMKLL